MTFLRTVPYGGTVPCGIFFFNAAGYVTGTQKCVPSEMRTEMRTNTIYGACGVPLQNPYIQLYGTVQYCRASLEKLYEALVEIKYTTIAKLRAAIAAKFIGILRGVVANAMAAPRAALFSGCRRSIEHVSKMPTLRGSSGNHVLLLSLN